VTSDGSDYEIFLAPPGAGAPPTGYDALPPLLPDRRPRSLRLWVLLAVTVVVLAGTITASSLVTAGDDAPLRPVTLPAAVPGGLVRSDGAVSERLENAIRSRLNSQQRFHEVMASAAIASYGVGVVDPPTVTAIVFRTANLPGADGMDEDDVTSRLIEADDPAADYVADGPHGGSARCETKTEANGSFAVCGWMDSSTVGILLSWGAPVRPAPMTVPALSRLELQLRDLVD
jgi:hypothetical protein